MKTHELIQGTTAWHEFRLQHFGGSEAAAMLGLSRNTKRSELLRMKKTGIAKEFSDWVQAHVLDKGHAVEAPARQIIEEVLGEDLYPVTCSDGDISASCDGLTMSEEDAWENKQWNEAYAAIVRAGQVPEEHMPQCQQVLMVTKARRLIFSISDGTRARTVWVEVLPDPAWFERLRAGWAQFKADLANYVEPEAAEVVTGRTPESLPALRIEVTGAVTASNLAPFKEHALAVFSSINRDLKTDQDFADAEKAVKWCGDVEERLAGAKQHALSQTESIDALFRTIDDISAEARRVRLDLDKLVKARKEAIRGEIVAEGVNGLRDHLQTLNESLGRPWMPVVPVDFGGAIKGKKNLDSMRDAVSTALANAKIEANATAEKIRANLVALEARPQYAPLFPDARQLVLKAPDDLAAVIAQRVTEFEAAEAKRKTAEEATRAVVAQAAAPATAPAPAPAKKAEAPAATLKLGTINERLAPLTLSVDALRALGFEPVGKERAAVLYAADDFPAICAAIVDHIETIAEAA